MYIAMNNKYNFVLKSFWVWVWLWMTDLFLEYFSYVTGGRQQDASGGLYRKSLKIFTKGPNDNKGPFINHVTYLIPLFGPLPPQ